MIEEKKQAEIDRLKAFIHKNAKRHRKPKTKDARTRRINVTLAAYSKLELATGTSIHIPTTADMEGTEDIIDDLPFSK